MCELNKWGKTRVDPCMREAIAVLNARGFVTVACCCGHGKYPMTIVYRGKMGGLFELFSGKRIPSSKKIYKRDKQGYFYIPKILEKQDDTKRGD